MYICSCRHVSCYLKKRVNYGLSPRRWVRVFFFFGSREVLASSGTSSCCKKCLCWTALWLPWLRRGGAERSPRSLHASQLCPGKRKETVTLQLVGNYDHFTSSAVILLFCIFNSTLRFSLGRDGFEKRWRPHLQMFFIIIMFWGFLFVRNFVRRSISASVLTSDSRLLGDATAKIVFQSCLIILRNHVSLFGVLQIMFILSALSEIEK